MINSTKLILMLFFVLCQSIILYAQVPSLSIGRTREVKEIVGSIGELSSIEDRPKTDLSSSKSDVSLWSNSCETAITALPYNNSAMSFPAWYVYYAEANGNLIISSEDSNVDTDLKVYNTCGGVIIGQNDDINAGAGIYQSRVSIPVIAGQAVYINWLPTWSTNGFVWTTFLDAPVASEDSLALVNLYMMTNGVSWTNKTNWLTGPVKNWYGVAVDAGRVREINLDDNNLIGSIPSTIGNISRLKVLVISNNLLSGSLPKELGDLTKLQVFYAYNNLFGGELPNELGNMTALKDLWLDGNSFEGSIPSTLGNLISLKSLAITDNKFTGTIPKELANLSNLEYAYMNLNRLSGALPQEFTNLTSLIYLNLNDNQLTSIPDFPDFFFGSLFVRRNNLTFESIEPNINSATTFGYHPQLTIQSLPSNNTINEGSTFSISASIPGSNNQYQWFRNGTALTGATTNTLTINTIHASMSGQYYLRIKSPIAPSLTLYTDTLALTVIDLPEQTITFPSISDKTYGAFPVDLYASSSSNLPISYSIVSGPGSIVNGRVVINGAGIITVAANQPGNDQYNTAPTVQRSFTVAKKSLSAFAQSATLSYGDPFPVLRISYNGFVYSDDASAIDVPPTITTGANASSNAGVYPITISGGTDNSYYFSNYYSGSVTINKAWPIITINPISRQLYSTGSVNVQASSTVNSLPLNYSVSGPATISGTTITFTGGGNVSVRVSQTGNQNYESTYSVMEFEVVDDVRQPQIISLSPTPNKTYGDAPITINATSNTSLPIWFDYRGSDNNTIIIQGGGNELAILGVGRVIVKAYQYGNDTLAYSYAMDTFEIEKTNLTVEAISQSRPYGTANPRLELKYTGFVYDQDANYLNTIPTVSTTATLLSNVGEYPISVLGGSSDNYNITRVNNTLTIYKANQNITLTQIADKSISDGPFDIEATVSSGLPMSNRILSGPATLNGGTITLTGAEGVVIVEVSQPGDINYNAAVTQTTSFIVRDPNKQVQTITITPIEDQLNTADDFVILASTTSGLELIYEVTGPASIDGNTITLNGALGTVIVTVSQAGNSEYSPATATETFEVIQDPCEGFGVELSNQSDVSCFDGSDGAVAISVNMGTAPFIYDWSNNATTEDITGLSAGNYTLLVTDVNNCEVAFEVTIEEPAELSATAVVSQTDYFTATGAIDLTVSGGTLSYTYSWSNDSTSQDLSNLEAGTYTVSITDSHHCVKEASFEVTVDLVSGVNDLSGNVKMQLFPNPAESSVTVKFESSKESVVTLELVNALGEKVLAKELGYTNLVNEQIVVDKYVKGIYFIRLVTESGTHSKKLMIK